MASANPTNLTPIPTPRKNTGQGGKKGGVGSHLVVVDAEKESMQLKQQKNGLTKNKYKMYSRMAKKNCTREANLTRPRPLRLSGKNLNPIP